MASGHEGIEMKNEKMRWESNSWTHPLCQPWNWVTQFITFLRDIDFFYHYIFTFYIFHYMIYYERDTYEIELKVWVPFLLQFPLSYLNVLFVYSQIYFKVWFTFIYQTVLLYCSLFVCISYLSALLVSILYWNKFYALILWIRFFFISGRSSCLIRKTVVDVVEIPNKSND